MKGFSLVELLVVVAIIAILAIVAIPRILVAVEHTRRSEALATATLISDAMTRYYIENESYPDEILLTEGFGDIFEVLGVSEEMEDYLDLRNPASIMHIEYGEGDFIGWRDIIVPPAHPHHWYIHIVFAEAEILDSEYPEPASCVITSERIRWNGKMRR